jgi:hypothetical protein
MGVFRRRQSFRRGTFEWKVAPPLNGAESGGFLSQELDVSFSWQSSSLELDDFRLRTSQIIECTGLVDTFDGLSLRNCKEFPPS